MDIYSKKIGKEERMSLEMVEEARQKKWKYPSFTLPIFYGEIPWGLIYPFPLQEKEDKERGDEYLKKLKEVLLNNLDPDRVDEEEKIPQKVMEALKNIGAFSLKIPPEYNGLGLSQTNYNRAIHLVASFCGSTAVMLSAHQSIGVPQPLLLFGTEEQKKKYLPRFREGAISGFALTEPSVGSDPGSMKTTASLSEDGKYYLLNGEKLWCSNGNIADILIVMAKTPSPDKKVKITAFIVETNTPGFKVVHRCRFMGIKGVELGVIKFENVKVPKENIILGEGEGLKVAFITLNTGRLTLPAASCGMIKWCLAVSRSWANKRKQWGQVIGRHQAIATKLSRMAAYTFALEAVYKLTSSFADKKKIDIRLEAALAKIFSTETAWRIINDTFQIRGGRGFERAPSLRARGEDAPAVERVLRDSRINLIIEGSSEILRLFISREALDKHLEKIKTILKEDNFFNKIKNTINFAFYYLIWYVKLFLPVYLPGEFKNFPFPIKKYLYFSLRASRKLAKKLFLNMVKYQKELPKKQNILFRCVDIATDIFVILAVCFYAESIIRDKKRKEEDVLNLVKIFYLEAKERINNNFQNLNSSLDKTYSEVSNKILEGNYSWLEDDIIFSER